MALKGDKEAKTSAANQSLLDFEDAQTMQSRIASLMREAASEAGRSSNGSSVADGSSSLLEVGLAPNLRRVLDLHNRLRAKVTRP